jgi:hypothetical protein
MAKAMARFCKATLMVPCCRGAEHAASRRGRIRIIALPTVEDVVVAEVVVAVSMEPRRCGRARKHGRGCEYQESKFPCHDRGSSALVTPGADVRVGSILLKKSFWEGERKFLGPLMRFARGDVRDHIVSSKIDHGPP